MGFGKHRQVALLLAVGPRPGFLVLNSINRWRRNGNDAWPRYQIDHSLQAVEKVSPSSRIIVGCDWSSFKVEIWVRSIHFCLTSRKSVHRPPIRKTSGAAPCLDCIPQKNCFRSECTQCQCIALKTHLVYLI
jgi:hypothetical protein